MLIYCRGRLSRLLIDAYPSVHFDEFKFRHFEDSFWTKERKRKFFDTYAKNHNFDPLVAEHWYNINAKAIIKEKGRFLKFYGGSLAKALLDCYPEITWNNDKFLFPRKPRTQETRRSFFNEIAEENNFDPLVPDNWYNLDREKIVSHKGAFSELAGKTVVERLLEAYPEIGLIDILFPYLHDFWTKKENRKKFFDRYAQENKFDPLVADHWYSIQKKSIINHKGASSILEIYNTSVIKAVMDSYPNIGLEEHKFAFLPRNYWEDLNNRKAFFERFAQKNLFNPLIVENWYNINKASMKNERGFGSIPKYHSGSWEKALTESFPTLNFDQNKLFSK